MITENLSTLQIHKLTQAQYNRELAAGRIDANALYLTPETDIDFPVDSVNGKIGAVTLTASDVGASESGHTHNYAGSSSAGGAATSANKLTTNAGSATQPVYFVNGVPTNTTHTLGASVPAGAKFTDTLYIHPTYTSKSSGLYKITVDSTGHVSGATSVKKSDITALGIPAQDTTYTLSSFGLTATAAELNYCDGVTSNIQTQLNGKAASSHNHAASEITSGTLSTSRLPTITVAKGGTGSTNGATGLKNLFAAGNTVLSSYQYGSTLPSSGTAGQLFFLLDE